MNKHFLVAKTPTQKINYSIESRTLSTNLLCRYLDSEKFSKCCEFGCNNYGVKWSCPPFSPIYSKFVEKYELITVFLLTVELYQFSYIKNDYLKIKAANSILKSRIDKMLRKFKTSNTHYISTGSCRLCKPCKKKLNLPCAKPNLMSYSFESLGINVGLLTQELFSTDLLWYSKGNLPKYTSVVAGLLCNNLISDEAILETIKKFS